jgi:ribonucleoside-diphosphate reductase alpha chain
VLQGETTRINTPLGATYVTVNHNGDGQPFEVFIQTSKAGSDTAAISEAIGRLVSYILRLASPVAPRDRLKEIVNQLSGIGGGRPLGFGPMRVLSLPDGVAQVLADFLDRSAEEQETAYRNGVGHAGPQRRPCQRRTRHRSGPNRPATAARHPRRRPVPRLRHAVAHQRRGLPEVQ